MINYIMPVFIFMNLFEADLELTLLMSVLMFLILYAALTFVLTYFIGRAIGLGPGHQILFTNSNLFYNAGNYGVPVNDLVFRSDPFAMSVQIMMVFFKICLRTHTGSYLSELQNPANGKRCSDTLKCRYFTGLRWV